VQLGVNHTQFARVAPNSRQEVKMLAPHDWPKPFKQFVLTGATLLVIVAYMLMCAGSTLLIATLFSWFSP
jgi:hypothetical protein